MRRSRRPAGRALRCLTRRRVGRAIVVGSQGAHDPAGVADRGGKGDRPCQRPQPGQLPGPPLPADLVQARGVDPDAHDLAPGVHSGRAHVGQPVVIFCAAPPFHSTGCGCAGPVVGETGHQPAGADRERRALAAAQCRQLLGRAGRCDRGRRRRSRRLPLSGQAGRVRHRRHGERGDHGGTQDAASQGGPARVLEHLEQAPWRPRAPRRCGPCPGQRTPTLSPCARETEQPAGRHLAQAKPLSRLRFSACGSEPAGLRVPPAPVRGRATSRDGLAAGAGRRLVHRRPGRLGRAVLGATGVQHRDHPLDLLIADRSSGGLRSEQLSDVVRMNRHRGPPFAGGSSVRPSRRRPAVPATTAPAVPPPRLPAR